MKRLILLLTAAFLIVLFAISLFRNISYPLIWGDEGETAMYAVRILKYGYPKVDDGKNALNLIMLPDSSVAVNKTLDAYIGTPWLQYYFSVIGVHFANFTPNLYQKTALLRLPFAVVGFLGVVLLSSSPLFLFKDINKKLIFIILFFIFGLFSISLILHLREVRSYSLTILLSSLIINIFLRYNFSQEKFDTTIYYISIILLLLLLLNCFVPVYMVFMTVLGTYLCIENRTINTRKLLKDLLPLIITGILSIPFIIFSKIPIVSSALWKDMNFNLSIYTDYLLRIIKFLFTYHFLALAILMKFFLFVFLRPYYKNGKLYLEDRIKEVTEKLRVSNFLTYFVVGYIILIAITPFMFDRYFILLQPVLSIIIILDSFIVFELIQSPKPREIVIYILGISFLLSLVNKIDLMKDHLYELTHQYRGPLDYIVYFIKDNFRNPENLTIATNHEVTAYMYYLDSKIYTDYNNKSDAYKSSKPDLIIPRKYMMPEPFAEKVNILLNEGGYKKTSFPIYDYPANNIPELSISLRHLFRTKFASNDSERVDLYIKENAQ